MDVFVKIIRTKLYTLGTRLCTLSKRLYMFCHMCQIGLDVYQRSVKVREDLEIDIYTDKEITDQPVVIVHSI